MSIRWFQTHIPSPNSWSKLHALEVAEGELEIGMRLAACGLRPRHKWGHEVIVESTDREECCTKCVTVLAEGRMHSEPGAKMALVEAVSRCIDQAVASGLDRHTAWDVIRYRAKRALSTKHV